MDASPAKGAATKPSDPILGAAKRTYGELGVAVTILAVWLAISNLTIRVFKPPLLPFLQATFEIFHQWCRFLLEIFVLSWLLPIAEAVSFSLIWVVCLFLPVRPWWPDITVPAAAIDVALVSIAFTRVFSSVDLIIPRDERAAAEAAMTKEQWALIPATEGPIWGPLHRFVERINASIWKWIELLITPLRSLPGILVSIARALLIGIAGSVLMWGFIRLAGYLINVLACRRLDVPVMRIRRRFLGFFGKVLLGAVLGTAAFIVGNGWAADWLASQSNPMP